MIFRRRGCLCSRHSHWSRLYNNSPHTSNNLAEPNDQNLEDNNGRPRDETFEDVQRNGRYITHDDENLVDEVEDGRVEGMGLDAGSFRLNDTRIIDVLHQGTIGERAETLGLVNLHDTSDAIDRTEPRPQNTNEEQRTLTDPLDIDLQLAATKKHQPTFDKDCEKLRRLLKKDSDLSDYLSDEVDKEYLCPISFDIMIDPVALSCGHIFDSSSLRLRARNCMQKCPMCRKTIHNEVIPIFILKQMIHKEIRRLVKLYKEQRSVVYIID